MGGEREEFIVLLFMYIFFRYHERRGLIHMALCDSVDTPTVMRLIREIITFSNTYMNDPALTTPNAKLLESIAQYVTYLLKVFGVINTNEPIGFPQQTNGQTANTVSLNLSEALIRIHNNFIYKLIQLYFYNHHECIHVHVYMYYKKHFNFFLYAVHVHLVKWVL